MNENEKLIEEAREALKRPDGADLVYAEELLMRDLADALERSSRGAKTLGEIVERQVEDTLRWAGMEDQIGTNDPDQMLAWERCAEMPGRIAQLEAEVADLRTAGGTR